MAENRKQIAFDLDTAALKEYYPSDNWRGAYAEIKMYMKKHDFTWQQGSVYVSEKNASARETSDMLDELAKDKPWLNKCMKDCRMTNIGRSHDQTHLFDKDAVVPTRLELMREEERER